MRYEVRDDPEVYDSGSYDPTNVIVRIEDDGTEEIVGYDHGEPEDNSFTRDYRWVAKELNKLAKEINELKAKLKLVSFELASIKDKK